jgi:hypothetical protein
MAAKEYQSRLGAMRQNNAQNKKLKDKGTGLFI